MLSFLVKFYAYLPLAWVRGLGRMLGWAIYGLDGRYRDRVQANLFIAGQTSKQIRAAAISGVGAGLAESPWVWGYSPQQLMPWIVCEQKELLVELRKSIQPVIFLTPHLGSFEMTARFLAAYLPITVLYKEPAADNLKAFMAKIRNADNLTAVPANLGGVKTMLKALKNGQAIGMLPDQVPTAGEGVWTAFFERPAYTMTLPERLAKNTGARVVIVVGTPLKLSAKAKAFWRFELEEMLEAPSPENINRQFEKIISKYPELYLWGYNRYKRPPGAPEAPTNISPISSMGIKGSSTEVHPLSTPAKQQDV
jgi:Kdo2-lipid IVA lauroyltransferase/acyltransferase